jgi:hypothetical protein
MPYERGQTQVYFFTSIAGSSRKTKLCWGGIVLTFLGSHFKSEFSALLQYKFILLAGLTIYTTELKGKDVIYIVKKFLSRNSCNIPFSSGPESPGFRSGD